VLALPSGSVPEVVQDGINGRLCDDVEEMADWIRDPCIDPANCRRHAERYLSVDVMIDAYEKLYREALADARQIRVQSA
jgi:glycosyltransferase involved in cell wall biosynthesis